VNRRIARCIVVVGLLAGPARAQAPVSDAPQEVTVRGDRRELGQETLRAGEIRQLPGAFGDAFRAIDAMPGVTPIASGFPYFFVRGAPPGNTGYFLDGVRVPLLFHIGVGPSVIHPGLLDRVDFLPGGYPARFGRFAGGIVTGETTPPATRSHGEANVRLFDAGALHETPFADGRGTVLAAARYGYPGLILPLIAPDTRLSYWDYQTRATFDLGPRDTVGVFVFGSHDALARRDSRDVPFRTVLATDFHRLDARFDHAVGDSGRLRLAATLGIDKSADDSVDGARDTMVGLRMEYEDRLSEQVRLRAGADVTLDHYAIDLGDPADASVIATQRLFPARDDLAMGARGDVVLRVAHGVEIVPGLRADVFTSNGPRVARAAFDPRLATRNALGSKAALISTFGVSHQPGSFFVPVPGLQLGASDPKLQTSYQTSQGIEVRLPLDVTATGTLFLHDYLDLTDATATCGSAIGDAVGSTDACQEARVRGRTYGLEVLARRPLTRRVSVFVAYTLSRSTREAHPARGLSDLMTTVPSEFDRTHVLSAAGALDLGRRWRAGARFYYYSGRPYSLRVGGLPVPPYNSERLPDFWRIDLRLEKRWPVLDDGSIALVFEGLNVTLNKEAVGADCESASLTPKCTVDYAGPLAIPSVGVELRY
jgi:TonB-dependent Receptor Plug Domain